MRSHKTQHRRYIKGNPLLFCIVCRTETQESDLVGHKCPNCSNEYVTCLCGRDRRGKVACRYCAPWVSSMASRESNQKKLQAKFDRLRVKIKALKRVSGGRLTCKCCRESHVEFLTIDHIENDGNQHRETGVGTGQKFYEWVLTANDTWIEKLQVLCFNCNWAKGVYGYCPHEGLTFREGDLREALKQARQQLKEANQAIRRLKTEVQGLRATATKNTLVS